MRTLRFLIAASVLGAVIAVKLIAADAHPNFTGTWVIDVPATAKANGKAAQPGMELTQRDSGAPAAPRQLVMEQTGDTMLKISGGRGDTVYQIDNVAHKNKVPTRGGDMELVVKAKWDGAKLVTSVVQRMTSAGELQETETKETRSIDKEGRLLYVFDRSVGGRAVPDMARGGGGGGGAGGDLGGMGGGAASYKAIYTKKP
jgi:hypothetical protein